jgi:hypothetical protein
MQVVSVGHATRKTVGVVHIGAVHGVRVPWKVIPLCEWTLQIVPVNYGTRRTVRCTHRRQCMVLLVSAKQAIVGMDNASGVYGPCN